MEIGRLSIFAKAKSDKLANNSTIWRSTCDLKTLIRAGSHHYFRQRPRVLWTRRDC